MHSKVMLALLNISDLKGQFIYMLEDTFLLWFRILVQLPWTSFVCAEHRYNYNETIWKLQVSTTP